MQLVEIIKGEKTSPETLARAYDYVLQIGKTPIVVNDSRGFYTSRTFGTFVQEGCAMLAEGIPAAGDRERRAPGRHAGGAAGSDRPDLDVALDARDGADHRRPQGRRQAAAAEHPGQKVIVRMVKELNRPGRAAGGGFYDYPKDGKKTPLARTGEHLRQARRGLGHAGNEGPHPLPPGDRNRALPGGGRADDGARRQHRLHLRHRLSRLDRRRAQFINSVGVAKFVARADELAKKYGERFAPPKLLRDQAAKGEPLA